MVRRQKRVERKRKRQSSREKNAPLGLPQDRKDIACVTDHGEWIKTRSQNQSSYINLIRENDITIGIGPAGTGKTFLAVAVALQALRDGEVSRIIITRPMVEAGERMGFLPGTLEEKIDPYLRPIYDAFDSLLGPGCVDDYLRSKTIEIAPLAYMRGRTLDNSYIILDEAQNATAQQIEMFLTRMGEGSKVIVNGDVTQVDLPKSKESGLQFLNEIIGNVRGVAFQHFTDVDVVRHPLVKEIVTCYERWKERKQDR